MKYIKCCKNSSMERKSVDGATIFLGAQSVITNTNIFGNVNINAHSHINNCQIGRYFNIGLYSYIANSEVGNYCTFGSRLSISAFSHPINWLSIHEFQYRDTTNIYGESLYDSRENILKNDSRLTIIGNDVWVADNSVVLSGLKLGNGCIIGASSVVVKDVPPYAIVAGNPARIIKYRFSQEVIDELERLKWWDLSITKLRGIQFDKIEYAIEGLRKIRDIDL